MRARPLFRDITSEIFHPVVRPVAETPVETTIDLYGQDSLFPVKEIITQAPIAEPVTPPTSMHLNDGGFVLTMGPDGTIVCGSGLPQPVEPVSPPTSVHLNDGGFVLTMGPDGTIVCGDGTAQPAEPKPAIEFIPHIFTMYVDENGTITCGKDPVQTAIDDYIVHTSQPEASPAPVASTPAVVEIAPAQSGTDLSGDILSVNHEVIL